MQTLQKDLGKLTNTSEKDTSCEFATHIPAHIAPARRGSKHTLLRWHCLVFVILFHFPKKRSLLPKKKFSTPEAIIFHIKSNYGIRADNRN